MKQVEFYLNQSEKCSAPKINVSPNAHDTHLLKENNLSDVLDKEEARSNLGITPLLEQLSTLISNKVIETGGVPFDLEPNPESIDKVLSSASIYNFLLHYATKDDLTRVLEILELLRRELDNYYDNEEIDNKLVKISNDFEKLKEDIPGLIGSTIHTPLSEELIELLVNLYFMNDGL